MASFQALSDQQRKRGFLGISLMVAVIIMVAVLGTFWHVYGTTVQGKALTLTQQLMDTKALLEEQGTKERREFRKTVLLLHQGARSKGNDLLTAYDVAINTDDGIFFYVKGFGDPAAKHDPKTLYLLDADGKLDTPAQGDPLLGPINLALSGKQGVMRLVDQGGHRLLVAYARLDLAGRDVVLLAKSSLVYLQRVMLKGAGFLLLASLVLIGLGVWAFMRLNPLLSDLIRFQKGAVSMLGRASHYKDTDTGIHVERMAEYSLAIAKSHGMEKKQLAMIHLAAKMHDLGKVGTPDAILKKPGRLNKEECEVMKQHSEVGADVLGLEDTPLFEMAREIANGHHEKYDGSGYPQGLAGEDIPLTARITAVADVFDALTMKRPYKDAWPTEKAVAVLQKDAGTHFDPKVVEAFMAVKDEILAIKARWDAIEAQDLDQNRHTQQAAGPV